MSKSPRVHTPAFKAQVALAALKGDRTLSEIAAEHQVHVKLVQAWNKQILEQAASVFASSVKPVSHKEAEEKQAELYEQIGRLKVEREWVKKKSYRLPVIGSDNRLNITAIISAFVVNASY